jgi:hypothetical protein
VGGALATTTTGAALGDDALPLKRVVGTEPELGGALGWRLGTLEDGTAVLAADEEVDKIAPLGRDVLE